MINVQSKTCLCCKETKPLESFKQGKRYLDSYSVTCLSCLEAAKAERAAKRPPKHIPKKRLPKPPTIELDWSPQQEADFLEKTKWARTDWSAQALGTQEPLLYFCSCCKEDKDIFDFGADSSRPSGVARYCKQCTANKRKEKQEKLANSAKEHYGFC